MQKRLALCSILLLLPLFHIKAIQSDSLRIDSLKKVIKTAAHDSIVIMAWKAWDDIIYVYDPELDLDLNQKMVALASKKRKSKLHIKEKLFYQKTTTYALNNIGTFYYQHADYARAFEHYFKSLKIAEELKDSARIALTLGNIANVYFSQENYDKSLEYNQKSLKMKEDIGHKSGIAITLSNIASVYSAKKDHKKALESYFEALKMAEELNYTQLQANTLLNIGLVYFHLKLFKESEDYFFRGLKMYEEIGDKNGIAVTLGHMGSLFINMGRFADAEKYLFRASALSESVGARSFHRDHHFNLSRLYDTTGRQKLALEHYKKFIAIRDSIASEENLKNQTRIEMNYEFETKQALAKAEQQKKDEINRSEKKKQFIVIVLVSCVLLVVIVFAIFIARNLRTTRKQKLIIEEQKTIVEEKHKEITDSINYAERIQRSFLASKEVLESNLRTGEYFVMFKPKDIVSGDFYWAANLADGSFIYVTADSTGHGVPGAIMSILNISSLEKAIEKHQQPNEILNYTRSIIIERLKKDGTPEGGKDGMDGSLVILDKNRKQLRYAASNNPVWIVRNHQLLEFAFDKFPVGRHDHDTVSFTNHTIDLQPGDVIYTFTDGMPDQFGGPKGKKFKYTRLKEVLLRISALSMADQQKELDMEFCRWKGDLEQIDDVCVMGVRI